jgi:hypothetical protein
LLSVCFWQSIYAWGPILSNRIFSHREITPHCHDGHYVEPRITGRVQLRYPDKSSEKDARKKQRIDLFSLRIDNLILSQIATTAFLGNRAR